MASASDSQQEAPETDAHNHPLPLPAPPNGEEAHKLDLSSGEASVRMDHLGPLVVNQDGSLSRISNWQQMTEPERKSTLRLLGKRNQLRTEALKAQAESGDEKKEL
ncbi:hypothetical protein BST61_czeina24g000240 [Lecanosticta acicola]|uniref:Fungal specific transcription factor n=1 Tax=Lecanosticta acicola TaxID=111012 RepID=A0AAI8W246_9PEZI|nr:hypothetical protein BST61_czeina24g000240 [Lecanosticta acicola]